MLMVAEKRELQLRYADKVAPRLGRKLHEIVGDMQDQWFGPWKNVLNFRKTNNDEIQEKFAGLKIQNSVKMRLMYVTERNLPVKYERKMENR